MSAVLVGTAIEQTINIFSTAGVLADPATLEVIMRDPSGDQTTYTYGTDPEITRTSTGVYVFHSPALDEVSTWWIAWLATGTGVTVSAEASQEVCGLHVSLVSP